MARRAEPRQGSRGLEGEGVVDVYLIRKDWAMVWMVYPWFRSYVCIWLDSRCIRNEALVCVWVTYSI